MKMRAVQVLAFYTITLLITANTIFSRFSLTDAALYNENPAFGDYPTTFSENIKNIVDIGACNLQTLSGQIATSFQPLSAKPHWRAVNVRLGDFEVGREALCKLKCVVLGANETNRKVMAVLARDCSKCEEGQIMLTKPALRIFMRGQRRLWGRDFFSVVDCPMTWETFKKYGMN